MKSCLVVDDDTVNRFAYIAMLDSLGLKTIEADNAIKALSMCEEDMPDIIILDWFMPKMTGLDFLAAIKEIKTSKRPYIIMCSAQNPDDNVVNLSMKEGADIYLNKPLRIAELRDQLVKVNLLDGGTK